MLVTEYSGRLCRSLRSPLAHLLFVNSILLLIDPVDGLSGGIRNVNLESCLTDGVVVFVYESYELMAPSVINGVVLNLCLHLLRSVFLYEL